MFRGSIVALITPFRNGSVDEAALRDLVEWHIAEGTHGFVPTGTTGESPTLSHDEHDRVIEVTIEVVNGRRPVIAGTGSNSTAEAIRLTRHAEHAGADAALVVTPYYNKPTQAGLFAHYQAIHDATDIPIIIYNIPGRSVIDMSPETMGKLAALPRIAGVKDSSGDIVRPLETHAACGADFCQLTGEDGNVIAFLAHGGGGAISVTANVAPRLCSQMHTAWQEGRHDEALAIQRRLLPLHNALFSETSPGPIKYAVSRLDRCSNELRLPMVPASDACKARVDAAMIHAGLLN
ncbi:MAG: 4-hydroxy-tetrahydrodipicolinate synthase [Geminicoccaceae bacterium]|nr:4-hydroxy-tetrahydrodipicolinate synthase [Geminicoccaceae bacterium]MCB9942964.1 4-hydroxy-tetrahydrodipicolinate synthase [Geminicoccaceae bacterium]